MRHLAAVCLGLALFGCTSGQKLEVKSAIDKAPATAEAIKPAESNTASTANPSPGSVPSPTPASIPDSLKHDGYRYFGLANLSDQNLEVTESNANKMTGKRKLEFSKLEGNKAIYNLSYTSGLEQMGQTILEVRPDGLYSRRKEDPIGEASIELPAKLEPGKTWNSKNKLQGANGQMIQLTAKARVKGTEKVTVPTGTFEAILVESEGDLKIGEQSMKIKSKEWFVKDRGNVKSEVTTVPPNGAPNTSIVQEAK